MRLLVAMLSASCLFSSLSFAQTETVTPTAAPTTTASSAPDAPVTRSQIPALVREALVNDPSILDAAVEKMKEKQEAEMLNKAKAGIDKHKKELFSDASSPVVGSADADVTIIEFFDYHCGYCKKLFPDVAKLISEDKKVRFIFKEMPILSEDSVYASRAALAVNRIAKDKYFAFHSALMAVRGKYDEKTIMDEAKKLGIDTKKLKTEMSNSEISVALDTNRGVAEAIGVRGTPAVIVGDNMFPGAMSYDGLKQAVEAARAKASGAATSTATKTEEAPKQ